MHRKQSKVFLKKSLIEDFGKLGLSQTLVSTHSNVRKLKSIVKIAMKKAASDSNISIDSDGMSTHSDPSYYNGFKPRINKNKRKRIRFSNDVRVYAFGFPPTCDVVPLADENDQQNRSYKSGYLNRFASLCK